MKGLLDLAKQIARLPTAPFHEAVVMDWLQRWADQCRGSLTRAEKKNPVRLSIQKDVYGNLLVRYRHARAQSPVAFAAHTDHPGFVILPSGCGKNLRAEFLGGVSSEYFQKGVRVALFSARGQKLGTAQIVRRLRTAGKIFELRVLPHKKQVPHGSAVFGMWDLPAFRKKGNVIEARVCDDLMGVVAICAGFEQIVAKQLVADVTAVFTRAEEVGFVGAIGVAKAGILPADCTVISIENSKALSDAPLGQGPVIRVGDRSSIFDPAVTATFSALAGKMAERDQKFRFQRRLMYGGSCEGTAYRVFGYKTGALCLPMENYHNMGSSGKVLAEKVDFRDMEGLVNLIVSYADSSGAQIADKELKKRLDEIWITRKRKLLNANN